MKLVSISILVKIRLFSLPSWLTASFQLNLRIKDEAYGESSAFLMCGLVSFDITAAT